MPFEISSKPGKITLNYPLFRGFYDGTTAEIMDNGELIISSGFLKRLISNT
jgi:hypothetical protein